MKHSPAPWKYSPKLTASENHKGFSVFCAGEYSVSGVSPIDADGRKGEANARLIAAAPELLEALKALKWLREAEQSNTRADEVEVAKNKSEIENLVEAAIAKAQGEKDAT